MADLKKPIIPQKTPDWLLRLQQEDSQGLQDVSAPLALNTAMLFSPTGPAIAGALNYFKGASKIKDANSFGDVLSGLTTGLSGYSGQMQNSLKQSLLRKIGAIDPRFDFTRTTR